MTSTSLPDDVRLPVTAGELAATASAGDGNDDIQDD